MYDDAKALIAAYFHQLTQGCGAHCTHPECKSSPDFAHSFKSDTEAALTAIKLAKGHTESPKFCKNISPMIRYPHASSTLAEFTKLMTALIHNQIATYSPVDIKKIFESVACNPDLIPFAFDEIDIHDFLTAYSMNRGIFESSDPQFSLMIHRFLSLDFAATYRPKGLFNILLFENFFAQIDYSKELVQILQTILQLPAPILDNFGKIFTQSPESVAPALSIVQTNLTLFILSNIGEDDIYTDPAIAMSRFISFLRTYSTGIPVYEFYSELLSDRVDFEHEIHRAANNQFCYIQNVPAILTLVSKTELLRSLNKFLMDRAAISQIISTRHQGRITQEDLTLTIKVHRGSIVEDTVQQVTRLSEEALRKRLNVIFEGEQGVDAGGVSREFFYLLSQQLFSMDYGMFNEISDKRFWFNAFSFEAPLYFQLVGTLVGLAIYNSIILPTSFPLVLYKKLLNTPIGLEDLKELDESVYNSLKSLYSCDTIDDLGLFFAVTVENLGVISEIELKKDAPPVTQKNFEEYIQLYLDYRFNKSVQKQYAAFAKGFWHVCPLDQFKMFIAEEVNSMVSGQIVLDWDSLKETARYADGYTENSKQVKWFWELFEEMSSHDKMNFLRFATGSDRAPVGGLAAVNLVIQRTGDLEKLPVSHTCFSIFALPEYPTKEVMKQKILLALEHTEGFGLI